MPDDADWRLNQAQALLDVFEQDCGRPARDMAEIRNWVSAQDREQVQLRVKHRLLELLSRSPTVHTPFRPPPASWRVLRRNPKRHLRYARAASWLYERRDALRQLLEAAIPYSRVAKKIIHEIVGSGAANSNSHRRDAGAGGERTTGFKAPGRGAFADPADTFVRICVSAATVICAPNLYHASVNLWMLVIYDDPLGEILAP
jgi:hypothetical protein